MGKLLRARASVDGSALPIALAKDVRVTRAVQRGEIVRTGGIELGEAKQALTLRREAEGMAEWVSLA